MSGFVDEAQIHVKAGNGGAGMVSFRREAHVSKGGPDGGDGGSGGGVWLVADLNQASLLGFRDHPHRRAADGSHGKSKKRHGGQGADVYVPVPVGTVVKGPDDEVLADLADPGSRWLAATGGRGGFGNARFLNNRRRAPAFAEQGEVGEERWLDLELKLSADVALVGLPNAGKSTLISKISAARPKIADYPFTTLEPHLGVVRVGGAGNETEFVVADIPGLVRGAAEGRGLGHRFLRHVERARVLVVLLDLASAEGLTASGQLALLLDELGRYRPELLTTKRLHVGTRADIRGEVHLAAEQGRVATTGIGGDLDDFESDVIVSAATGEGLDALLGMLAEAVSSVRTSEALSSAPVVIHRPLPVDVEVRRADDGSWVVAGRAALRAVALNDLTDPDAISYVQGRLRRLGVERALVRAGVHEGDTVHLGPMSFTYHREDDPDLAPRGDRSPPLSR